MGSHGSRTCTAWYFGMRDFAPFGLFSLDGIACLCWCLLLVVCCLRGGSYAALVVDGTCASRRAIRLVCAALVVINGACFFCSLTVPDSLGQELFELAASSSDPSLPALVRNWPELAEVVAAGVSQPQWWRGGRQRIGR